MDEETVARLGEFYSGRFDDPTDGCVLTHASKKNSLKLARKELRRWLTVFEMNGLTVVPSPKDTPHEQ